VLRVALTTLGCKVNRADGLALLARLGEGFRVVGFEAEADVYIVNTCTVTATADRQSRQLLYRARRRNPSARVVLTGCFARVSPEEAARIPVVDRVFSLGQHPVLLAFLEELRGSMTLPAPERGSGHPAAEGVPAAGAPARARPCLKVQDGCNAACSYCIVPRARGPSRSVPEEVVVEALHRLAEQDPGEVVLSGIHLGAYGRDLDPPTTLVRLIRRCASAGPRLRLSSVDPQEVDPELRSLLEGEAALCPHLHLPIQSGADEVLAAMNRPYRSDEIRGLLEELRQRRAELALGADLIAGFPGETEAQAAASVALVEASPLTHLHVFPFSPRPGTPASARADQLPRELARARAAALRQAGRRKLLAFAAAQLGQVRDVLVESTDGDAGRGRGLSDNYLRVALRGLSPGQRSGARLRVLIEDQDGSTLRGRPA